MQFRVDSWRNGRFGATVRGQKRGAANDVTGRLARALNVRRRQHVWNDRRSNKNDSEMTRSIARAGARQGRASSLTPAGRSAMKDGRRHRPRRMRTHASGPPPPIWWRHTTSESSAHHDQVSYHQSSAVNSHWPRGTPPLFTFHPSRKFSLTGWTMYVTGRK